MTNNRDRIIIIASILTILLGIFALGFLVVTYRNDQRETNNVKLEQVEGINLESKGGLSNGN